MTNTAKANGQKKVLSASDFFKKSNLKMENVYVEELGGTIYLQELSGEQFLAYNERIKSVNDDASDREKIELTALLLCMSACDEERNLMFTEQDAKKILETNSMNLVNFLGREVLRVSGVKLTDNLGAEKKPAEELKKT